MNAELVKSQETARKFQEFLVVERERNKSLKVRNTKIIIHNFISLYQNLL